jgi:hypothetical protein
MGARFKNVFVLWPKRLFVHEKDLFEPVGWVWLQRANLVKNLNYGWIATVKDQTPEKLARCPCCNQLRQAPQGGGE